MNRPIKTLIIHYSLTNDEYKMTQILFTLSCEHTNLIPVSMININELPGELFCYTCYTAMKELPNTVSEAIGL